MVYDSVVNVLGFKNFFTQTNETNSARKFCYECCLGRSAKYRASDACNGVVLDTALNYGWNLCSLNDNVIVDI